MDLTLAQLEAFCKVAELRSFTRAAESLHLAQASLSERISALESQVGCRLLDRSGRRTEPTDAGRTLYPLAARLLRERDAIVSRMLDLAGVKTGIVRVAAGTVPGEHILPTLLPGFRKRYPGLGVVLEVASSERVVHLVVEGLADVGFVGSAGPFRGLDAVPLWDDALVVVVPAGHRWARRKSIPVADLATEPFVSREQGSGTSQSFMDRLRSSSRFDGLSLDIVAVMDSSAAVKTAVMSGLGVSVLSSRAVAAEVQVGLLASLRLADADLARKLHLVTSPKRTLSPAARALVDYVTEQEVR
jgi:DNA-binding transcriptional LysR family regulator